MLQTMESGYCNFYCTLLSFLGILTFSTIYANDDAKRLYHDLLLENQYNKLIRPVGNNSDKLIVRMGIRLSQLIDVDEKNQVMTTNVWLRQEWHDISLVWNPDEYGGIKTLEVPSTDIWLPDIVLFNNADGKYEVTLMTMATLHPNGLVVWEPPAIYKSSCMIDVEFFPYDYQLCSMQFGSWTYDGDDVDIIHSCATDINSLEFIENGVDLRDFYQNVEWDILRVTAQKKINVKCCYYSFPDITFNVTMRRKTLFHTVNLVLPCVGISFLTILVFYLPSDSGEKITLCISILLSLIVFFLLLAEIIPPTSTLVPLITKYLTFTMAVVTLSIIVTVIVLNVHFRSPSTHTMTPWARRVFLYILPKLLLMRRPNLEQEPISQATVVNKQNDVHEARLRRIQQYNKDTQCNNIPVDGEELRVALDSLNSLQPNDVRDQSLPVDVLEAIDSVVFIAEHLKKGDFISSIEEDWKYVAMVLDRMFLWIFSLACLIGTFGILLQAPAIYDNRKAITDSPLSGITR